MIYQHEGETLHYELHVSQHNGTPEESTSHPTLLFLHGALGSMSEFDRFLPRFEDRDSLLLDLPGHGQSQTHSPAHTTRSFAQLILRLLEELKIKTVDIIGYSLGGYVGIEMALQSPTHLRSIISHAMKFYWTNTAIDEAIETMRWNAISQNEKRRSRLEATHPASGAEQVLQLNSNLIEHFRESQLSIESVQQLRVPLLLSVGDRDELVPISEILSLYQALGYDKASLAVHANTPHPISKLSPDSFEKAARQFWHEML